MLDIDTVLGWRGRTVRDVNGEKIGTFGDVYLDRDDAPAWAGVQTGLFGRHESFVPLHDGCAGHARWASRLGRPVVEPTAAALRAWAAVAVPA